MGLTRLCAVIGLILAQIGSDGSSKLLLGSTRLNLILGGLKLGLSGLKVGLPWPNVGLPGPKVGLTELNLLKLGVPISEFIKIPQKIKIGDKLRGNMSLGEKSRREI